jgi:hypothetical protein
MKIDIFYDFLDVIEEKTFSEGTEFEVTEVSALVYFSEGDLLELRKALNFYVSHSKGNVDWCECFLLELNKKIIKNKK